MTAKFFAILTSQGAALLANATALGTKLSITKMAVGDGNGTLPTPDAAQTKLVNQKRIAPLNMLSIDANNSSQIIAEQVIPENEGGFWIREIGLYDDNGNLIAVANCPETYKPQLQEGSGRTQTIRMVLIVSSTAAVTLKIDPSVVLATRKYVDDAVIEVKAWTDEQLKKHIAASDPHQQYAPKDSPQLTGTPRAPTAPGSDNSDQIATTAFVKALIAYIETLLTKKAALDSPVFFGAPTAPTAPTGNNTQLLATTAFVHAALKAALDSPVFYGAPTAPTAPAGNNTQLLATTAFVQEAITQLVNAAPSGLDTLRELADAVGNDPHFASTVTNILAGKQPLDSTLTALSGKGAPGVLSYLGLDNGISGSAGRLIGIRVLKQSGNYKPSPGARFIICDLIGGGGGGGSNSTTVSPGYASAGTGGNAGSRVIAMSMVNDSTVLSAVIGAGGAGGAPAANGNDGVTGGDTSLGVIKATGGRGGLKGVAYNVLPTTGSSGYANAGNVTPGSDTILLQHLGRPGDSGFLLSADNARSGKGGDSEYGNGGVAVAISAGVNNSAGNDAVGFGSGGSGAVSITGTGNTGVSARGGAGSQGLIVIREYA